MFRYLIRRVLVGDVPLPRDHVRHVRDLLHGAQRPGARDVRQATRRARHASRRRPRSSGSTSPSASSTCKFLNRLVVHQDLGHVLRDGPEHQREDQEAAPGDGVARLRRRVLWMMIGLPVGIFSALAAAIADRPSGDGLRPDRRVGAPGLDRADLLVLLRLKWHITPIADYANFFGAPPDSGAARRSGAVGLPHDPALDDVRHPVRGALRAHDQGERDGDPERGLRAHRARQGRARVQRILLLARAAERAPAGRHDARHGHRRSRSAARSSPRPSTSFRGWAERWCVALGNDDLAIVEGVVVFATIAIIFFNLIVDLLYAWIDPRIRLS